MDPKQQVIDAGIRMLKNGITIGAWGNISLRDPESGLIYLTPSGMAYDTLVREDIVVLTPDGTIREGKRKPQLRGSPGEQGHGLPAPLPRGGVPG